ncbi:glycosyl transferase [Limnohabitans sp. INBF002]|nr:glycosyl transferase [Limnohabitans sp. INBF002]
MPETMAVILRDQPRFLSQHFEVALVTSPGCELNRLAHEGVSVHVVPMRRGISPLQDFVSVCRMVLLMFELRPEIVHSYTPKAGLVCMLAAWLCRVPIRVHTFTGLIWPTRQGWKQRMLKTVDSLLCACATHIVPEGRGVLQDLQAGQITSKPLYVIGHGNVAGVDVEYFSPHASGLEYACAQLRLLYKIEKTDFVYAFVGRLNRDKGVNELLAAFENLPNHSRLIVVGGLDDTAPVSNQAMSTLTSHPRIHWVGFQHDIRPALLAADVLVLPSYREGFPNVVLQAGAMERPVVATDISGCNEIIAPGLNGWLVPVKNTQALTLTMRQALNTPVTSLQAMGRSARKRVVERFERGEHWRRMLAFYSSLDIRTRPFQTMHKDE